MIAIGEGGAEWLQQYATGSTGANGAGRLSIERATVTVWGKDLAFFVQVAAMLRRCNHSATRQGIVALAAEQALTCQVNGDQCRTACGLHVQAGSLQIEFVRNAGGEKVGVVAGVANEPIADGSSNVIVCQHVVGHVFVEPTRCKDPDVAVDGCTHVAGLLEGFPRTLEEQPMLRIKDRRITRAHPEERGIELIDVLEWGCIWHVARVADCIVRFAGGQQFVGGQLPDRFDPASKIRPECGHIGSAGETARHANDRDSAVDIGGLTIIVLERGHMKRSLAAKSGPRSPISRAHASLRVDGRHRHI